MTNKLDTALLDHMIETNSGKLAQVVSKHAFIILGGSRMIAPRDPARPPKDPDRQVTGALKENSDVTIVDDKGLVQDINFYQEYAIFQELGAPANNMPARPFLTPTTEADSEPFVKDIGAVLEEQ
jgi:hypothetical protein